MNGDGKLDLISANIWSSTLSILTNNGSGGFVLAASPQVGSNPYAVTAADVNGDGKVDLISANRGSSTLTILTNNGSGGFVLAASPSVGSAPQWVTAADVNGDGKVDLISANSVGNSLTILTNNGSGGFVLAASPTVGNYPVSVCAADLNGDGRLDLVSANYNDNSLSVLLNTTQFSSCTPPPAGLVSWWPAEENANDIIGGNNGMLMNGTGFTNGEVGEAFNLNGVNNFVLVNPATRNLDVGQGSGFTFEGWIKPTTVTKQQLIAEYERVLGTANGGDVGIDFVIQPSTILYANLVDTNQTDHEIYSPANRLVPGVWQHVALTYDKVSGNASLYINGTIATQTNLGSFTPQTSYTNLLLGARTTYGSVSSPNTAFSGGMDEMSIYSRALSPAEIAAIYSAGSEGKCAPATTTCTPPPAGLVNWWPAEGNVNDIVGGNNGIPVGNLGYTNGEVGQAFVFDNSTSYIPFPAASNLDLGASGSGFTIECWVKPNAFNVAVSGPIVEWDSPSSAALELWSGPTLFANLVDTSGNTHVIQSTNGIFTTNGWQHVALTYDKSSGTAILYYNGSVAESNNFGSITPQTSYPAYHLNIGRRTAATTGLGDTYGGLLDELSFYNRALSAAEIAAIYNAGSDGKCAPTPPPPTAHAAKAAAVETNGFVIAVSVADGGSGYTGVPLVRFIGGGGSGAQGVAVVSNGVVTGITVTNAGSGYTSAPVVVIEPPFISQPVLGIAPMSFLSFTNLTGGGTYQLQKFSAWYWTNEPVSFTATNINFLNYSLMVPGVAGSGDYRLALYPVPAQAFAAALLFNGFVVGANVTSGGSGYVTSPAVSIVGGGGTNAAAMAQISGGVVTKIVITDAGIGYTSRPTIRIAAPPAATIMPTVLPVMRVDAAQLAPYDNYQIQFTPNLTTAWTNWNGGLFSPTDVTNSQYLFITNDAGFFRLLYVP